MVHKEVEQLALPLPSPAKRNADTALRLWLAAAEPSDGTSLERLLCRNGHRFRHAFVDAGTGHPVIGATDLILVRRPCGREWSLIVPASSEGEDFALGVERLRSAISRILASSELVARRGQSVREIIALTFPPGRNRLEVGAYARTPERVPRSGLERLLLLLRLRHPTENYARMTSLCRAAENGLNDRVHPAVRALFRREYADALGRLCLESGEWDDREVAEIRSAYDMAIRDFAHSGFEWQSLTSRRRRDLALNALREPWLPGLESSPAAGAVGCRLHRIFGLPIDLALGGEVLPIPREGRPGLYAHAGVIAITDAHVLRMVRESASRRRRLVAQVNSDDGGVLLRVGVRNEFKALLGCIEDEKPDSEEQTCTIHPISRHLSFFPEQIRVRYGETGEFAVTVKRSGPHLLRVDALTDIGQSASLSFKLNYPVHESLHYA